MTTYNKYDVASKIAYVENYLKLCGDGKCYSIRKYCLENNLSKTTFYDWLAKYRNEKFDKEDSEILLSSTSPTCIELTSNVLDTPITNKNTVNSNIKLLFH